ncbi:MAG TPA: hypothetical protein DCS07_02335 [Bdellovibrionales bacterium]|nr:MAG: hypothetical protein A2X97_10060 [Bdellovibrionales bacterium GWA1_52_35]OFZ34632.1 MAG: hypothetical protein A2070_00440 [Bdellovibrionales bacterium GWC1_52_8]HAR41463.1 hypothetical protein [Bdellovibrionales bacterium]HCM40556.1 hypothetical protein [Bdellovibrionales bacterium]
MKNYVLSISILFMFLGFVGEVHAANPVYPNRPKLILTLVIDQFRADYLTRFESRFLPSKGPRGVGGFRYLMNEGAYYPFGQYDILHSMTGPGHATILTGAYPYKNGIPMNYWFDREKQVKTYCTEGGSPQNLLATTVGDELKNAGLPSRVVSFALKDRAAILMGGHRADLAFWFDNKGPGWTSSSFYQDGALPAWLVKLNREIQVRKGEKYIWNVSGKPTGYSADDAIAYQPKVPSLGKGFPHEALFGSRESFAMPLGLDLIETAAERVITAMGLGKGKSTDLLAISFSNHDYMGHAFGPNSLEMEEMTVAEDRVISKLLNFVQKNVPGGLKDVLIVLTADHGAPLSPEWMKAHKMDAGRIQEKALAEKVNQRLNDKFGKPDSGDWVSFVYDLEIYLNHHLIRDKKLDRARVQAEAKTALLGTPGLAFVFTEAEYYERKLPPVMHERQALKTYFPARSGDLVLIARPYWVPQTDDAIEHVTGYNYDRTVPVIFAGPSIRAGIYPKLIEVVDIAPTLSFVSGILMPSVSEGRVLSEVLKY